MSYPYGKQESCEGHEPNYAAYILVGVIVLVLFSVLIMFTLPQYNVWRSELAGRAELVRAEQNRKIKVSEAEANLEAEKLNAQAEIERAKGAAQAIEIEQGKLTETYIRYLWVRQQSDLNDKTIIYIPTEGGLPILESTRHIAGGMGKSNTEKKRSAEE